MRVVIVLKSDTLRSPVTENSGSFQFGVIQYGLAEEVFYQGIMWVDARSHEKSWGAFCSKVILYQQISQDPTCISIMTRPSAELDTNASNFTGRIGYVRN